MPKPNETELRTLFLCLLSAIKELWSHGYVHRDIKPKNVIRLDDSNRPFVLLDLGIAFCVRETALTFNPHDRVLATYRYLAPEMMNFGFRESIDYSPRDVSVLRFDSLSPLSVRIDKESAGY